MAKIEVEDQVPMAGHDLQTIAMVFARAVADTLEVASKIWRVAARDILMNEISSNQPLRDVAADLARYTDSLPKVPK